MHVLTVDQRLLRTSRLPTLSAEEGTITGREAAVVVAAGAIAALATGLLDLGLRVPGHAILRSVLPMALGLALVPRQMAGVVMGLSALLVTAGLHGAGIGGAGPGATASLLLTGPCLDLARLAIRDEHRIYHALILAGVAANVGALAVRGLTKVLGLDLSWGRPLAGWWLEAVGTYVLCGAAAGLLAAACFFRREGVAGEPAS